ncbi:MAG: 3-phosphoshikimate 1-carboxyvinyltransferase [Spirochaetes bacterium GWF1_51_8]|nr:MAG: 3-phosphoshikimate 1-carboxyvinyltransferase [Spirochaetes bacterium GWF1_51_8]
MSDQYFVIPTNKPIAGKSVSLPGSKSITNRALILAALATGETKLTNFLLSDDTSFMLQALQEMGYSIDLNETHRECTIYGKGPFRSYDRTNNFFIGNAGTAMRFLTSFLCLGEGMFRLDGDSRMRQRPIADLIEALNSLGCNVRSEQDNGNPPVLIKAKGLPGGKCRIAGKNSSQYISSILMAAPYSREGITLTTNDAASKPYIDMTLGMMSQYGVKSSREDYHHFTIIPGAYSPKKKYLIEPDASAASYFLASTAILGGDVEIAGLSRDSIQGDTGFASVLEKMGCKIKWNENSMRLSSDRRLHGLDIDMNSIPDMVLTLAVVALFADSPTRIRNVANLRIKESDRIKALVNELKKLGARVNEWDDGLEILPNILPGEKYRGASIHTYNDHRVAMSFAVAGLRIEGVAIENPGCVSKTFPEFFDVFEDFTAAE